MDLVNKVNLDIDPNPVIEQLPKDDQELYKNFSARFPFTLDYFQKYAIMGLLQRENVLVTVPTSSGKTIIAEFGITSCLAAGKRIIYTSPIKTLSNQKYSEFKEKFNPSDIGIITGDVKFNPDAPCLIMTTEILRDLLFKQDPMIGQLGMVIFDEVHYINNDDRGHVWEECLMLLPAKVQLILLSATISKPELFAMWIGTIKQKRVHLIVHQNRPVPLVHYLYDSTESTIEPYFQEGRLSAAKYEDYHKEFKVRNETSAINGLVRYLKVHNLCPALFFTFSRHRCEQLAESVTENFHTAKEQAEIGHIIDKLLTQYQYEFKTLKQLPQILKIKELAEKGIAFHHSGLLPFSKEIIEILFSKGLIKVMFVTETFSVGINMPTRTVVFTDLSKNVSGTIRQLYTDEFYQMAGRAGRRGLDSKGHVIYFPIKRMLTLTAIRSMIEGSPMSIRSRYQTDYPIILQQILNDQPYEIVQQSYLYQELERFVKQTEQELQQIQEQSQKRQEEISELEIEEQHIEILNRYQRLLDSERQPESIMGFAVTLNSKEQKRIKAEKQKFKTLFQQENMTERQMLLPKFRRYLQLLPMMKDLEEQEYSRVKILEDPEASLKEKYHHTIQALQKSRYLKEETPISKTTLTDEGLIAASVNNTDGLLITKLLQQGLFDGLDTHTLGLTLSLLTAELSGRQEMTLEDCSFLKDNSTLKWIITNIHHTSEEMCESLPNYPSTRYPTDLLEPTYHWLKGASYLEIAGQLGELQGNFVRSMLRLLRLCEELINVFQKIGKYLEIETKLREILLLVNREIIVFDSIYIK